MSRGPRAVPLGLSAAERAELRRLLRRRGVGQALAQRVRVVLACAEPGATNLGVARALGVSRQTVATWRGRFAEHRLEGLVDAPRSGAPRSIGDEAVERLVALTLEEAPRGATHWSTRSMARRAGMSQTAVSRIWRAFGLRPHRIETFKLSSDPAFVDKVRDVVGLYLAPPERALVLCVDEKPQIQAAQGTAPAFPMRPGQPERRTHDYKRHGTLDLFAALDVRAGTVIGACKGRHRAVEFRAFLDQVEAALPAGLDVHLVLDNLKTHKTRLDPRLAGQAPALAPAFHPDLGVLAQPRRVLVRAAEPPSPRTRRLHQHRRVGDGDPRLHRRDQRRPEALRLDQNRRRHPRQRRKLLPTDF